MTRLSKCALGFVQLLSFIFIFIFGQSLAQEVINISQSGKASQAPSHELFPANLANNGIQNDFASTRGDVNGQLTYWQLDLGREIDIERIILHNRGDGCCQSRLRDIKIFILNDPLTVQAAVEEDPTINQVDAAGEDRLVQALQSGGLSYSSPLLNPENNLGLQSTDGPKSLELNLSGLSVRGRVVLVTRKPDPDLSGSSGAGNFAEKDALSLGEVEVWMKNSSSSDSRFIRGDSDGNSLIEITDAIRIFSHLFLGEPSNLGCANASDVDDTGVLDITDGIVLLSFQFLGGLPPFFPFPHCGEDPTQSDLSCDIEPQHCNNSADEILLSRFAPIIHLHSDDEFRPSSVEWFLSKVSLVVPGGEFNPNFIALHQLERHPNPEALSGHILVGARNSHNIQYGESIVNNQCKAKCYAYVRRVKNSYIDLSYWFFYPWNGSTVRGFGGRVDTDDPIALHDGDWESLTVRIDAQEQNVLKVLLAAHGSPTEFLPDSEGVFRSRTANQDILNFRGDQVEVFSARHSHATYANSGNNFRQCRGFPVDHCFAVDRRDSIGPEWNTKDLIVNIGGPTVPRETTTRPLVWQLPKWLRFSGRWGGIKTNNELKFESGFKTFTIPGTSTYLGSPDGPATKSSWYNNICITEVDGVGDVGDGAGIAIYDLNNNGRPELILMAYDDAQGGNTFRYRVVTDIDDDGVGTPSEVIQVNGVGSNASGAGVALANIDGNGRPEMFLMAYDAPVGENKFRYRVGKNLNSVGTTTVWGDFIEIPGVGSEAEGADIVIYDLDDNGRPEMFLMAYDAPGGDNTPNKFKYRVGRDLDINGVAQWWSTPFEVEGVGDLGNGAGMSIFRGNDGLEMVLMAYDAPIGANSIRCRYSTNVNIATGEASWSPDYQTKPGFGDAGEGAAMILTDLNNNGLPDVFTMVYDDAGGASRNTFRYRIVFN